MAGLLDSLFSGNSVGGLLSYLNSPLYPTSAPKNPNLPQDASADPFSAAAMNPFSPVSPSQLSIWDQPGIQGVAAPAPSPFDAGTAPIANLGLSVPQGGPQSDVAPPAPTMPAPPIAAPPATAANPGAPPDASPIAVGNYMMPRIGPASAFAGQNLPLNAIPGANLPLNAAPTQGALPGGPLPPAAATTSGGPRPDIPGAMGQPGFLTGYENFRNGGGLIGSIIAGITGQRNDPTGIAQQNLGAQYQALRQTLQQQGLSPRDAASRAMLTLMNPAAAKATLPTMQLVKDSFGNQVPYWSNPTNQSFQPALGGEGGANASSGQILNNIAQARAQGANRQQLLQQIPAAYRGYVDSLLSGTAIPTNIGRSQLRGPIMMLAHAVDPTFNENLIPQRIATAKDFAPNGVSGKAITALNTVQQHIGKMSDDVEGLGNMGFTYGNVALNALKSETGYSPTQAKAIQAVDDDIKAVTDEMSAAYKNGNVSDSEINAWNELVNSNLSLPRLHQAMSDFVQLLNGKRNALNYNYRTIIGTDAPTINRAENAAITQRVMARNGVAPQVGTVMQGYRFMGGDPSNKSNWQAVAQ